MKSYAPAAAVTVSFALVDGDGAALTPISLRSRVLDEVGTELSAWSALAVPAAGAPAVVNVGPGINTLTAPAIRGARTVQLEVTTADGATVLEQTYVLAGAALVPGTNSFQTMAQAMIFASDMADTSIPGWVGATQRQREQAMTEAYDRIVKLPIELQWDDTQSILQIDSEFITSYGPYLLRNLSATQILNLYPQMLEGLRKAQLVEADEILNGDPVREARKGGLLSMTVGESSQFFRSTPALDLGVSDRALKFVSRWIRFGVAIGRR